VSDIEEDSVEVEDDDANRMLGRIQELVYHNPPLNVRHEMLRARNQPQTPPHVAGIRRIDSLIKRVEDDPGVHQAAIATELQDKLTRKNEQACVKVARDASLLEDIESEIKELMEQPLFQTKQGPLFMPKPPTSTYEACAQIGVESPALAALSPPLLKSPRYRAANSPVPPVPETLITPAVQEIQKTAGLFAIAGSPGNSLRRPQSARPDKDLVRVLTMEDRCNYSRLLNQQGSELQALDDSHSKYQSMLEQYSKEQDAMFAKQREFVAKGGHFLPIDEDTRIQLQLARMIGIAPDDPTGLA
jgi:hypothetical protein